MASSALLRGETAPRSFSPVEKAGAAAAHKDLLAGLPSKERLRLRLYAMLAALDGAALFLAFFIANTLWLGDPLHAHGVDMFVMALPLYLGIALNGRAYSIDILKEPRTSLSRASRSVALAVAVVIGTIFYLKVSAEYSRMVMAIGTVSALALICSVRWVFGQTVGRRYQWRFTNEQMIVDQLEILPAPGENVIYAEQLGLAPSMNDPQLLDRLGRLLKNCDRVVLACPPQRRAAWSAMMKGLDINVEMLAPELDDLGALGMNRHNASSTVVVSSGPLGIHDRLLKRSFDLAVAIFLLVLLLPLMGVIAAAIKLNSPGPIFFRQLRVGRGNRTFRMLKFRTMRVEASDHDGSISARRDDDRVTSLGRFLRRASLDELPQLFNVLTNDMSIVGPRPHALASTAEDRLFWNIEERYWDRHAVKPGITGLAQVRGFRGATFKQSDLSNRLQADLEYLAGWSIWRDIAILAATARVLAHKNAF